jgi:drug/metabolite transporter (DMT)-like permease
VALLEVVTAVGFAWLLLDELPRAVQLLGGLLIIAGVVTVKLGEPARPSSIPPLEVPDSPSDTQPALPR